MDGDVIDGRGNVPVAQPELPHIGIGHRHPHPRLDRPDCIGELGGRQVPAQQHLVADNHRPDRARIAVGQRNRGFELRPVLGRVIRDPKTLQNLQSELGRNAGDLFQPLVGRINPHAVGDPGEQAQILLDLGGRNEGSRIERGLGSPERRIGQAIELLAGLQRGLRHNNRLAEPRPYAGYDRHRYREAG